MLRFTILLKTRMFQYQVYLEYCLSAEHRARAFETVEKVHQLIQEENVSLITILQPELKVRESTKRYL